ncbi:putative transcriptional activator CaiF [Streptomyces sp. NBRC 110611]|uniref:DUF6603 domain-containing protein n=1 Tax=Streptomyces sp. NBRC 110611 TaxID=1621259 RepID=UPI000855F5D9|nr:DUF6603 domain-containing protein [Streptomyces sp. NBRC 110611]GAU70686.1 putative transcriptional activator CaiF [Streptomyces sp. NBRC 110611]
MAMTVDELRRRFPEVGGEFSLTFAELDIPGTEELFKTYLGGDLNLTDVTEADPQALTLTGHITIPHCPAGAEITVSFGANTTAVPPVVAGITADVTLTTDTDPDAWQVELPYLRAHMGFLRVYGCDRLLLVLSAEPRAGGVVSSAAAVGADLPFAAAGPRGLRLRAVPLTGAAASTVSLVGDFSGVTLANLSELAGIAPGAGGGQFALPDLPGLELPGRLELAGVGLVCAVDPDHASLGLESVLSASLRVHIPAQWPLLPGKFELADVDVEYAVTSPRHSPSVRARLGATLRIGEAIVGASVVVPELDLDAGLLQPLPLVDVFRLFLPDATMPTGDVEAFSAWINARSKSYAVSLDVAGPWRISDAVALTGMRLSVEGTGSGRPAGRLLADLAVGPATLALEAAYDSGRWSFTGTARNIRPGDLFGLFGVAPPALLNEVTVHQVTLSFDSAGQAFDVVSSCAFPLGDADATLDLGVHLTRRLSGGYDKEVAGTLTVLVPDGAGGTRALRFDVSYEESGTTSVLTATAAATPGVPLTDLASAIGLELPPGLPSGLLPRLEALALRYASPAGRLLLASATAAGAGVVLTAVPGNAEPNGRTWAALVAASLSARLSDLPLLAGQVPAEADLGVTGVQFLLASGSLTPAQLGTVNGDIAAVETATGKRFPRLPQPPAGLPKGAVLSLPYEIAGRAQEPLAVAFGGGQKQLAVRSGDSAPGSVAWADIGRSFGPLHVQRIGAGFDSGKVLVLFDASMGAAGFTLGVLGLGIALDLDTMSVEPRLQGLAIDLRRNPLHIAGALVNEQPPPTGYQIMVKGMLVVEMPKFGAVALGAYQRRGDGMTSLFAFGRLTGTFGGPPPFRVTGFALGFGYNSGVRVPEQTEIAQFPLVSGLDGGLDDDPLKTLALLTDGPHPWVRPTEGQIWLAGGIDFTSFEFVQARVLLLLEAGNSLTLALIGRATASFPKKGTKKYARVGVDLRIVYQSARGELAATAQLVDSYVIDPSCVLTGGFAFYSWFGPSPHAGNFVLTVGGYHPDYDKARPDYFPVVPRLGFTWSVGSAVTVSGGAYFALTPNAVMAGGSLDVRYKAGNVEAWLTARADLLIQWAPLHFRAGISVRVGARVKLLFTVSGEIGASLDLWGPPTGGTVTATFVFITVTVGFGAALSGPAALTWAEFRTQLLPPEAPLTAHPLTGLRTDSDADHALQAARIKAGAEPWLADPAGFSFAVSTVVPTARVRFNDRPPEGGSTVDIRPMKQKHVDGLLHVTVEYSDTRRGQRASWRSLPDEDRWLSDPVRSKVPFALWGDPDVPQDKTLGQDPLLEHRTGLHITVPPPTVKGQDLGPIAEADLAWEKLHPDATLPLDPDAGPTGSPVALADPLGAGVGVVAQQIANLAAGSARTRMHGVLAGLCPDIPLSNGTVGDYAEQARTAGLDADPLLLTQDPAPPAPGPVVLVLDDTTGAILSVDPATTAVVGRVPLGRPGPYLAATSADGATLYAAGTDPRQLEVVDVVAQQVRAPRTGIQLTGRPTLLAVRKDDSRAVLARPDRIAAASVDLAGSAEPVRTDVDRQDVQAFGGIAVDVEAGRLYVNANDGSKTVTYDTSVGSKLGTVHGPATPTFVTPGEPGRVYVYGAEASTNGQVQLVAVPTPGDWYQPYNFPARGRGLALLTNSARRGVMLRETGDGGQVVTLYERHGSTKDTIAESSVPIGPAPRALVLDPADRAWVLHTAAVSVVGGGRLIGELGLGARPLSVTFTPDAARAFVACADASVAVVEIQDDAPVLTERWPLPPGTVASAALYTVFADHSFEGAAR